jgi:hypothetical protein
LVGHTKPTTDCRLSFAFANKGNVAAGDNQSLVNTHDCMNPLIESYF